MNRTVWIARFLAVIIIVVFTLLMLNLHRKLQQMQPETVPVEAPAEE